MIKIGITGQPGFIGTHLYNTLGLYPDKFQRIECRDEYFANPTQLEAFVSQCDVIVHLAALNRHNDSQVIFKTNVELVSKLIAAMNAANVQPHVLFSSSTQEERDNPYGKSKKIGRELLEIWAKEKNGKFTGFVIPNVYGPFGHPYYNSVVATFCHQLTHGETPQIHIDGQMKLIYVGELVKTIIDHMTSPQSPVTNHHSPVTSTQSPITSYQIPHTAEIKVSDLLSLLKQYHECYFQNGIIPDLSNTFERNLFNTFICYIDHQKFYPFMLKKNTDNRGSFVEIIKLNSGGQISFSTTVPGITRGNHFHIRKAERFAVIKGKARIAIRRIGTDKILSFDLDGDNPSFVDMPVWFTHNITNIGNDELLTMFWISEHFDPSDPDTYFAEVTGN
jgi:UDP-2-acetamido-2,6-beta-L-arabino-hexul-4-ose reductase